LSKSRKQQELAKRLQKRQRRRHKRPHGQPGDLLDARMVKIQVHREIRYITQLAQTGEARIVTVGDLVFFSTSTGDAWLLDPKDHYAMCLCQGGEPQPFRVIETADAFAIEWSASFAIEGQAFVVQEQSGKVVLKDGYPTAAIAGACQG
jgi:hypothetical protein